MHLQLKHLLLITIAVYAYASSTAQLKPWKFEGTTPGIEQIFLGRCYSYLEIKRENRVNGLTVNVDCKQVWKAFRSAWAGKDPCKVTESDYQAFFHLIDNHKHVKDHLLFWSGIKELVSEFTAVNNNYYNLEETFTGYLADDLNWCGCNHKTRKCVKGIDYEKCSSWASECAPNKLYWQLASKNFAAAAEGIAYVMVNGTKRGSSTAYSPHSFFTVYELPTMGKLGRVRTLVVMVLFDLGVKPKERCGTGSIVTLVDDAKKYGIETIKCIDNPRMVTHMLCAKYPDAKQCKGKDIRTA